MPCSVKQRIWRFGPELLIKGGFCTTWVGGLYRGHTYYSLHRRCEPASSRGSESTSSSLDSVVEQVRVQASDFLLWTKYVLIQRRLDYEQFICERGVTVCTSVLFAFCCVIYRVSIFVLPYCVVSVSFAHIVREYWASSICFSAAGRFPISNLSSRDLFPRKQKFFILFFFLFPF